MLFESAVQALCDAEVDFIVIGGLAATFHGSGRVTYDLDVCYSRVPANLRRLAVALGPFHPRPREFADGVPFIWEEATLRNTSILTLRTDLGPIDLLAEVAGLGSFEAVALHSITVDAFDRRIKTLDLRSLIHAKRAAGRDKDLAGLPELEGLLDAGDLGEQED